MSRFSGGLVASANGWTDYGKSARRRLREQKRREAEERNARTPFDRTAKFRRDRARVQAALAEDRATRRTGGTA